MSVWVRAERILAPKLFSSAWDHRIRSQRTPPSRLGPTPRGFACGTAYTLSHGQPPPRPATLLRHSCVVLLHAAMPATRPADRAEARRPASHRHGRTRPGSGGYEPVGEYRLLRPFDYACRPRLRTRLTQGRRTWPWNPRSSSAGDSHPRLATHACILTSMQSTNRSRSASTRMERSPTHRPVKTGAASSEVCLSPATFSARSH